MSFAPTPTSSQIDTALRSFLTGILAAPVEVVRGQANRVPEPKNPDFVVFVPIRQERLATNIDAYDVSTETMLDKMQVTYQVDVHGPDSADNARVISTMFRDQYAVDAFAASGFDVAPLHGDDGRQVPFMNAEDQYEDRWVVELVVQANITVAEVPQQTADALGPVNLISVERFQSPIGANFLGFAVGGQLVVTEVVFGTISAGAMLFAAADISTPLGMTVVSQIAGTPGGAGAYAVSTQATIAPELLAASLVPPTS